MQQIPDSVKVAKTQIAKTGQIEEVAEAYNMPIQLATALDLDSVREDGDRALRNPPPHQPNHPGHRTQHDQVGQRAEPAFYPTVEIGVSGWGHKGWLFMRRTGVLYTTTRAEMGVNGSTLRRAEIVETSGNLGAKGFGGTTLQYHGELPANVASDYSARFCDTTF